MNSSIISEIRRNLVPHPLSMEISWIAPVGAKSRSRRFTSISFAFRALVISASSLLMISSAGMCDQADGFDVRKYEIVSSSAEISFSTSIILLIHSATCNTVQCLRCNASHPSHVDLIRTVPKQLPARQAQSVHSCRGASFQDWVLRLMQSSQTRSKPVMQGYPVNTPRRFP